MRRNVALLLAGNQMVDCLKCRMGHLIVVASSVFLGGTIVAFTATRSHAAEQTLAGAWNVTIVFDDPTLVGCTTPGLNTADGGIVAQGCDLSESPGYGKWARIGNSEFALTFVELNFGAAGTGFDSTYKVRARVQVNGDSFTGPFVTDIFGLDGRLLFSASGLVRAQRIAVEPL